jgi:hypothetical protein
MSAHGRPDPPEIRNEARMRRRRAAAAARRLRVVETPPPAEQAVATPRLRRRAVKAAQPMSPALPVATPEVRGWIVATAITAVVIAAASGWALRNLTTGEAPVPRASSLQATAGPASLIVDGAWTKVPSVPGLPPLDPAWTSAFRAAPGLDAYVVATLGPIDDQTLIPASLRSLVRGRMPAPQRAKLVGGPAWSYPEQWTRDNRRIELTVVPTTAGSVAVACIAPRSSWVAASGCAAGVRGLSLSGASRVTPDASLAVRARIPAVVDKLDARRVTLRAKLRAAARRRGQARFAKRLSKAYAAAAASLAPVTPAKGPAARTVAAMRASAAAHKKLAAAARKGWPKRYRLAKRAIKREDAALKRALRALR